MKEFKDWEAVAIETWPALKTFVHGMNSQLLISVQLHDMSGLREYTLTQNMYATLTNRFMDTNNDSTTMTVMQTVAAATTDSTLGSTYNATQIPSEVVTTTNQLSANQTTLLHQMAAMSLHATLPMPGILCGPPPFVGGGYNQGNFNQGGRFTQGCSGCKSGFRRCVRGYGRGGKGHTPFTNLMAGCAVAELATVMAPETKAFPHSSRGGDFCSTIILPILTWSRITQTGMGVTCMALTLKKGTCWQLAQGIGTSLHMPKLSRAPMHTNISTRGSTKQLSRRQVSDMEGWGMLHMNLTI